MLVDEDDDEDDTVDRLSSEDAWLFPVVSSPLILLNLDSYLGLRQQLGSVTLFGLYLVVKYLGKEWINWLLGWYFSIAGVGSVWKVRIKILTDKRQSD